MNRSGADSARAGRLPAGCGSLSWRMKSNRGSAGAIISAPNCLLDPAFDLGRAAPGRRVRRKYRSGSHLGFSTPA